MSNFQKKDKYFLFMSIVGIVLIVVLYVYSYNKPPYEFYNIKHIEMINNKEIVATVTSKNITKNLLSQMLPLYSNTYKLYIDNAYLITCTECGSFDEYIDSEYLSVSKEIYDKYHILDTIND